MRAKAEKREQETEGKSRGLCSCESPGESRAAPHGSSQRPNPPMGAANLQLLLVSFALFGSSALMRDSSEMCVSLPSAAEDL